MRLLPILAVAALLSASPAAAQLRSELPTAPWTVDPNDAVAQATPDLYFTRRMREQQAASVKSKVGSAALITGGLATMYLAYDVGEEDGGAFGTYIGVLGAAAFWAGVVRLVTR